MILADTSVWIEHLHQRGDLLGKLLAAKQIRMHPFVIGELAVGSLRNRRQTLADLSIITPVTLASHQEALALIESAPLYNRGIGYVDAHLLASCRLTPGVALWSLDQRLKDTAAALGVAAQIA
jgi:predicted nucleic acid-binding protein